MSVFRAANSTTAWPSAPDPFEDGPTERLAGDGPSPPPPRRGSVFAVLLAMLALLGSAGSGLLAWRALGRAEQAFDRPLPAASASAQVSTYADEALRIPPSCGTVTFVDLDEPRVNTPGAVGDLRYEGGCDETAPRLVPGPGAIAASRPRDADAGEDGCGRAVRTEPLGGAATVAAGKGLVLCVLTGAAAPLPSPQPSAPALPEGAAGVRLIRVEVTDVAEDGTAYLRATSWAVR